MRRTIGLVVAIVLIPLVAASCSEPGSSPRAPGPLRVVVSIPPLEGLVRALAPDAEIEVLVRPGQSPHGHEMTPSQMATISRADALFLVGLGLDPPIAGSVSRGAVWDMARMVGIETDEHDHAHDHGHEGHSHGDVDPHLWIDPVLVGLLVPELAAAVRNALIEIGADVEAVDAIEARRDALLSVVAEVDAAYREMLRGHEGAAIITHHNAWERLADRYGLEIAGVIELAEGVEPSLRHLSDLEAIGAERQVAAVVTEPQLSADLAIVVAASVDAPTVTLDPLGAGDWESLMFDNLAALVEALAAEPDGSP